MIVSLGEFKRFVGIDLTDTTYDDLITQLLSNAQDYVETACHRHFESADYTEKRTGNDQNWLYLREAPITAISSLKINNKTIDATRYEFGSTETGQVILTDGSIFTKPAVTNRRNITISYTAGYTSANVPMVIKQVIMNLTAAVFSKRDLIGIPADSPSSTLYLQFSRYIDQFEMAALSFYRRNIGIL